MSDLPSKVFTSTSFDGVDPPDDPPQAVNIKAMTMSDTYERIVRIIPLRVEQQWCSVSDLAGFVHRSLCA